MVTRLYKVKNGQRISALLAFGMLLLGLMVVVLGQSFTPSIDESKAMPGEDLALSQPAKPLGSLLKSDGTLNLKTGFTGSLDARGWEIVSTLREQPRFVQAGSNRGKQTIAYTSFTNAPVVPGDENWDDRFGLAGLDNRVDAIATNGSDVYVGGTFGTAGGIIVNGIAKWDGSQWSALGSGVNGGSGGYSGVNAIAINGSDVYVGGNFTTAGGINTNHIAKWDGSQWSALGSGVDGLVIAIAASGTDLYAGGLFYTAGGVSANNIAKWDGSQWSALGSGANNGVDNSVFAIATSGSNVYVGGAFGTAGGISVHTTA